MFYVTLFLIVGILFGFIVRKKLVFIKSIDILTAIIMLIMLFSLGLSLGSDKDVLSGFYSLGLTALLIMLFSVLGSVVVGMIIYRFFFRIK